MTPIAELDGRWRVVDFAMSERTVIALTPAGNQHENSPPPQWRQGFRIGHVADASAMRLMVTDPAAVGAAGSSQTERLRR